MASQSEPITVYDVPNYAGEVFYIGTAFGKAPVVGLCGLNAGYKIATSEVFPLANTLTPNAAAQNVVTEDASIAAMTDTSYAAAQENNYLEIHRNTYVVSHAAAALTGAISGTAIINAPLAAIGSMPVQRRAHLLQLTGDLEYSFLRGTAQAWTNAATSGATGGVLTAVEAGSETAAAGAALSTDLIHTELVRMGAAGAEFMQMIVVGNGFQITQLNTLYGNAPTGVNIGGVDLDAVYLPLAGKCGIVHCPHLATDDLAFLDLAHLSVVFGLVPGKPPIFTEPIAQLGAGTYEELYCLFGCDYDHIAFHGMVSGLATT